MTRIPTLPVDACSPAADEDTRLLPRTTSSGILATRIAAAAARGPDSISICAVCRRNKRHILLYVGSVLLVVFGGLTILSSSTNGGGDSGPIISNDLLVKSIMLGKHKRKNSPKHAASASDETTIKKNNKKNATVVDDNDDGTFAGVHTNNDTLYPKAEKRCDWVIAQFQQRDAERSGEPEQLRQQYAAQDGSVNIFYRATANIFWRDFKDQGWGSFLIAALDKVSLAGGAPVVHKNTWTWVTGDQHLSNFGAWQNRAGEVVFGGTYFGSIFF
jgi:Uncharacterized protein conserved in bacteria (DUF2252)